MKITLLILSLIFVFSANSGEFHSEDTFGANPGNLLMKTYTPTNPQKKAPLVVLLHGCMQSAEEYATSSGWIKLADKYGFYLLLPSQVTGNNSMRCFSWYENSDITRDKGEIFSIHNMIMKIKSTHPVDQNSIFVTGLSAGASMAGSLLAIYPETFKAGALIAGLPHGCARTQYDAFQCMFGFRTRSPKAWKEQILKDYPYSGRRPRVSIWQGESDRAVKPLNAYELVEQWTAIFGIDQEADKIETISGHQHYFYQDKNGKSLVEMFMISGAHHGQPVSPGNAPTDCGSTGQYFIDANICASFHIGKFFKIVK
ncbi:MAG: PHB depolymerase family esterase [Bacteriovoracaceae bacterium]|nr:PHB depolymerase family esterase [Bacteriovoracaceae bacterium]